MLKNILIKKKPYSSIQIFRNKIIIRESIFYWLVTFIELNKF